MIQPEWGNKVTCPKCSTRFYDLHKSPIICINCGEEFLYEPVLKSKQLPVVEEKPDAKPEETEEDLKAAGDEDLETAEADEADDSDILEDVSLDDDDADLSDVVDTRIDSDDES
ncbi:MAG: TIGR02300 family protein [Pseudomonadota bacterium]